MVLFNGSKRGASYLVAKCVVTQEVRLLLLSECLKQEMLIGSELSFVGHSDAVKQSHRFTGRFVSMACVL